MRASSFTWALSAANNRPMQPAKPKSDFPTLASRHPRATKTVSALLGSDGKERSGQLLNFVAFAFGACWRELFVFGNAANQGDPFVTILAQILIDWHKLSPPVVLKSELYQGNVLHPMPSARLIGSLPQSKS